MPVLDGGYSSSNEITVHATGSGTSSSTPPAFALTGSGVSSNVDLDVPVDFILPGPEMHAVAYVVESVQLSSVEVLVAAYITNNVTDDIPTPHIWYVVPDEANRGEVVAVVGTGFGATKETFNGFVTFGPTLPTIQTWTHVATSLTPLAERLIHHWLDVADPEHQRITFPVPDNALSGEVRVLTNTDAVIQSPPPPPTARFDADSASAVENDGTVT